MSDRPTPETDDVAQLSSLLQYETVNANFARKLERERDEARRECKFLWDERDEARAELTNLESLMFGGLVQPATKNALAWRVFDAVMAMKKERDEAREALRQIWQSGDAFLPYIDEETTNRWRKADGLILFLDEIQTAPEVLAKLRWFAEDMPELPVVAAGS